MIVMGIWKWSFCQPFPLSTIFSLPMVDKMSYFLNFFIFFLVTDNAFYWECSVIVSVIFFYKLCSDHIGK